METLDKPYVTAYYAAGEIGVPVEVIESDVSRGIFGALDALVGGFQYSDGCPPRCFIPIWELQGERLAMHRARLADTSTAGQP